MATFINNQRKTRVTVQATLTVVSSTPVERDRSSYILTPLDHAMKPYTLHVIYYYKRESSAAIAATITDSTFGQLRTSLSELLCLYPTITGRVSRDEADDWRVKFTDAGVRTVRAKVTTTLDEWMRSADLNEEMDLTVIDDLPDDTYIWSPFQIQMTEFECGGLALALSCTHLLADATSISLFINSWAQSHRGDPITHPPSNFISQSPLLHHHRPPSLLPSPYFFKSNSPPPLPLKSDDELVTATFTFSDRTINEYLFKKVETQTPDASPFDLLTALFWTRILETIANDDVIRENDNPKKFQSLSICVDFRKRLRNPLPYGYFGNAQFFSNLRLDDDRRGDFVKMVELVHRHVAGLKEEEFWAAVDWLEEARKKEDEQVVTMYGPQLTCINMEELTGSMTETDLGKEPRPILYSSAFEKDGKERPIHVSYNVGNLGAGEGLIFVMPAPEGGMARRVKVVLNKKLVGMLCEDHVIRKLEPGLFISGGK